MENIKRVLKELENEYNVKFTTFEKMKLEGILQSAVILAVEGMIDVFIVNRISGNLVRKYKKIAKERAEKENRND